MSTAVLERKTTRVPIAQAAAAFLAQRRIAVTGVSRKADGHGGNVVFQRLRDRGYEVFAVNPNAEQVEGATAYPNIKSIPGGVGAVVIATSSDHAQATVEECAELGIQHVWMHRSVGPGSVSRDAAEFGRRRGISVIDGGCPLMFEPVADGGHKMMKFVFTLTGAVPRRV